MDALSLFRTQICLIVSICLFASCGKIQPMAQEVASELVQSAPCTEFREKVFSLALIRAETNQQWPTRQEVLVEIKNELKYKNISVQQKEKWELMLVNYYGLLYDVAEKENPNLSRETLLSNLSRLEIEDQADPEFAMKTIRLKFLESEIKDLAVKESLQCNNQEVADEQNNVEPHPSSVFQQLKKERSPTSYGALKTTLTAYQTCHALEIPPLTSSTPAVQGISIIDAHPQGGLVREITDLKKTQITHPYLKNDQKGRQGCFNVYENPLIYNFGGKPYVTSLNKEINFFRRAGTGSKNLGVDCSGFVFSSLFSSGLKVSSKAPIRTTLLLETGSNSFFNPQAAGFDCLESVIFNAESNLKEGDIVAGSGHVIIIESIGSDPFGIAQISKSDDCQGPKINSQKFDFTVIQSAPVKSGVGIDRMKASDYLETNPSYKLGLLAYARDACVAKTKKIQVTPKSSYIRVTRHKNTPACIAPEVILSSSDCVKDCQLSL